MSASARLRSLSPSAGLLGRVGQPGGNPLLVQAQVSQGRQAALLRVSPSSGPNSHLARPPPRIRIGAGARLFSTASWKKVSRGNCRSIRSA